MSALAIASDSLEFLDDRDNVSPPTPTTFPEDATLSDRAHEDRIRTGLGTAALKVLYPAVVPLWLGAVHQRIKELLELRPNWDGYGGRRIDFRRAQLALDVLSAVMTEKTPIPDIVPGSDGGVQLEWHCGQVDLEVEALSPLKLSVAFEDLDTGEEWERETYDFAPIAKALDRISQREDAGCWRLWRIDMVAPGAYHLVSGKLGHVVSA